MAQANPHSPTRDEEFLKVLAVAAQRAAALMARGVPTHKIDGTRRGWIVLQDVGSIVERRQVHGGEVSGSARMETQYENVLLTDDGQLLVETCFDKVLTRDGKVSFRELQLHKLTPATPESIRDFDFPRSDSGWRLERHAAMEIRIRSAPRTYKHGPSHSRLGGAVVEALNRLPGNTDRPTLTELWWDWSSRKATGDTVPPPPPPVSNLKLIVLVSSLVATIACCGACLVVPAVIGR